MDTEISKFKVTISNIMIIINRYTYQFLFLFNTHIFFILEFDKLNIIYFRDYK